MMYDNHYIYAIRHNVTGKVYIGCTAQDSRVNTHLRNLKGGKHSNKAMQKDCDEYGYKFTAYLLEIVTRSEYRHIDPHEREAFWIQYYNANDPENGYNSPHIYARIDITTFPKIKGADKLEAKIK